jgi:hypothetical protein
MRENISSNRVAGVGRLFAHLKPYGSHEKFELGVLGKILQFFMREVVREGSDMYRNLIVFRQAGLLCRVLICIIKPRILSSVTGYGSSPIFVIFFSYELI